MRRSWLCLLCLLLPACGGGVGGYMPSRAGMIWEYALELRTMDGLRHLKQVYYGEEARRDQDGILSSRQDLAGHHYYYRDTPAGIDALLPGKVRRLVARPYRTGTEWTGTQRTRLLEKTSPPQQTLFRIEQELPMRYRITAMDAVIAVPAGIYRHCMRVDGQGTGHVNVGNYIGETDIRIETRDWYAPGVGLVRSERREFTSSPALDRGEMLQVLERFRD